MSKNNGKHQKTTKRTRTLRIIVAVFCVVMALLLMAMLLPWQAIIAELSPADSSEHNHEYDNIYYMQASKAAHSTEPEPEPQHLTVTFSAVGDNLIHDGIYLQARARAGGEGYDFTYAYENLAYFFEQFDVNWINQETLMNNELPAATYPCFSTPGQLGEATYAAGWRVFSISNNHIYDMGAAGIAATRRFWAEMPDDVLTPGLFVDDESDAEIAIHTVNGITIAYLSYTEHTNGLPTPPGAEAHVIYTDNYTAMERQIRRARELADFVVVAPHWGVEGSHTVTQAQRDLAAQFADWGADVVIGTHPHVIQEIEWIQSAEDGRQVLVAYSLGNFLSSQAAAMNMVGLALTFEIKQTVEPDGTRQTATIESVKAYPTVTHYDAAYKNIRDYMVRDYTEELAAQHGVRERNTFSKQYITDLVQQYISSEFLVLN